ncbi:hypothetical protein TNCV_3669131 [Trichonephila clavipes]|nr:hypothetical protein TNCV_3669131 [Trichonephila clavipes]
MEHLQFQLEIGESLSASPPTSKSILTDDGDNSVVVPLAKRSKLYNPPATHVMAFILAIPDHLRLALVDVGSYHVQRYPTEVR